MSALLDDIINLAVEGKHPLTDLLRKVLLLGHELKNDQLKAWANQELNGYGDKNNLPDYRVIPAQARGNFIGPMHCQLRGHLIASIVMEAKHREFAEVFHLLQSVSAYQDAAQDAARDSQPGGTLIVNWPPNLVAYYQSRLVSNGYVCHSAWQEIPTGAIVELLDAVRNRTLNIALQLKDELGTSYSDLRKVKSTETENNIQSIVFQNTGGHTTVAVGTGNIDASTNTQLIVVGDRKNLDAALEKVGMDQDDLKELTSAIQEDGPKQPGRKVTEWIKAKAPKVVTGGIKVGVSVGQQLLTEWLLQHYGLKKP